MVVAAVVIMVLVAVVVMVLVEVALPAATIAIYTLCVQKYRSGSKNNETISIFLKAVFGLRWVLLGLLRFPGLQHSQ